MAEGINCPIRDYFVSNWKLLQLVYRDNRCINSLLIYPLDIDLITYVHI